MPGRYAHVCIYCLDRQGLGVRGYPRPQEYAWYDPPLGGGPDPWAVGPVDPWFVGPHAGLGGT